MQLVDPAIGVRTWQPTRLHGRKFSEATRLLDGGIICAGGVGVGGEALSMTELSGPPIQVVVNLAAN